MTRGQHGPGRSWLDEPRPADDPAVPRRSGQLIGGPAARGGSAPSSYGKQDESRGTRTSAYWEREDLYRARPPGAGYREREGRPPAEPPWLMPDASGRQPLDVRAFIARRRERRARLRAVRAARRTVAGRHPFLTAFCAVTLILTPVWVSLGSSLTNPSLGSSVGARFAEWARSHGAGSVVNWAENAWYSSHPPPVGGTPAKGTIPGLQADGQPGGNQVGSRLPAHLPKPARMTSPARHELAGEGVWHPAGRLVGGIPAVYQTWVRPDGVHTSLVTGVAWMDTKLLQPTLYSGSTIPGGGPYPHTAPISAANAKSVVAAFNAGFLMQNAQGGYYTDHKTIVPLRNGDASFVIYRNGSANIGDWGRDFTMNPNVVSVRQNLALLVDHGKAIPGLNPNDTTKWGFTLGNSVYVWRSGVGITANGALVYVGGPGLNITTLAELLVRAGAVRAMELDINTDWVDYATYDPRSPTGKASPANGKPLLPDMVGGVGRYFASYWSRDFFVMSARYPPAGAGG
jgi:hypothetical protein